MENTSKRRGWVKNAVIIFLAVMLILTFFSNTIMNHSLPEVSAQYAHSGSITAKIRTTSTVEANEKHEIDIEESRVIRSVAVREGEDVEVGDVLFYLEDAESAELQSARETLAALEREYELSLLTLDEDFYSEELAIIEKQRELSEARAQLNNMERNKALVAELEAKLKTIETKQKELSKSIEAYRNEIAKLELGAADTSLTGESTASRLAAAKQRYEDALNRYRKAEIDKNGAASALKTARTALDAAEKKYESLIGNGSADIDSVREQIADLEKTMRRNEEDFDIAYEKLDDGLTELEDAWEEANSRYRRLKSAFNRGDEGVTEEDVEAAMEAAERAEEAYESAESQVRAQQDQLELSYERELEDNTERLEKLQAQLSSLGGASAAKSELDSAESRYDAAEEMSKRMDEAFDEAEAEFTEAKAEYEALTKLSSVESYDIELEKLLSQSEALAEESETISDRIDELGGNSDQKTQETLIKALETELSNMQHSLNRRREQSEIDDQREQLEINDLLDDIAEQKEIIKKHEANSTDAKITATVAGQVGSLTVSAGMETSVGQTLCEIIVTELGYSCQVTLSAEQAARVRVGDRVEITNSWWGNTYGTIVSIRNDPRNPGMQKIATVELNGEVAAGQSLSLTIGEKGQTYDAIVPNSAIREDNNGKFVLVVEAKSSPLGNRYIATRYDVEVLASDDTNSAVSGILGSEFIITTSTSPITSGMQVRLTEN